MKTKDILPFEVKQWLILGGKLVTRILEDTDRGISQDGNGTKFPPYSSEYAQKKAIGKAGPKGVSKKRRNVYELNNKNEEFVKDFFDKEIDDRIIKFSKKDIIIDLKL